MKRSMFVAGSCSAALSACAPVGKPSPITDLNARATQLRTAFNADAGNVWLILLVSPT